MQDDVKLISLDKDCEESVFIKKGNTVIEGFDYMGSLWPLYVGKNYKVDIELQQLEQQDPELLNDSVCKVEKIDDTYKYHLYGYVKNNILHVGDFDFDFKPFNDYNQHDKKYIKFVADRINVEFLEEVKTANS